MPDKMLNDLQVLGCAGAFAAIGGGLHHMLNVRNGRPFTWRDFLLDVFISLFAGTISFEFLASIGVPHGACGAICGISGWMGPAAMNVFVDVFRTKSGVKGKESSDE